MMSRIDELIAQLCPDGIDVRRLGEVGEFTRGNGLQKKDLTEEGVAAIHYGEIHTHYGTSTAETKSFVSEAVAAKLRKARPGDLVIATTSEDDDGVAKAVAWVGDREVAVSSDAYIYRHDLEPTYVAHFFQSDRFQDQKKRLVTGTKVRRVSGESLAKIRIPVPPPAIQQEVARILTTMEALERELEGELETRRQQYVYYRDSLLTLEKNGQWTTLNELAENLDSRRRPVAKSARVAGRVPYYGASGIVDYVSDYIFDGDHLLVSEDGANLLARSTPIAFSISGKAWVNNHAHVLRFPSYAGRRFVEMYLNSIDLSPFVTGGDISYLIKS
jgi:type I restriction enzyme S subunit